MKYYELFLHSITVALSCLGSWKRWHLRKLFISMLTFSTFFLLSRVNDIFSSLLHPCNFKKIINNMQINQTFIRKEVKIIQEEDSIISSKEKILHFRKNADLINTYPIKQKKIEVFMMSKKLISILKSLIFLLRNVTVAILKTENKNSIYKSMNYIALYSDEQLGLNKDYEEMKEDVNLLPFIDSLKNVYIVMQSETLRTIGLYLCRFPEAEANEINILFKILHEYTFYSSSVSVLLQNLHEKHFYPSFVPKKNSMMNNKGRHLYNIMNSISSSLNGLLIDSRKLQDFIVEKFDDSVISDNSIGLKLLDMERDIACLLEYINTSSQYLLKKTNVPKADNSSFIPHPKEETNVTTSYTVGSSDFSVKGPDEVYLGFVKDSDNLLNENEHADEYVKPPYLNILISELKASLVAKREDFERREIKALKSDQDIESYKACYSECNYDISNRNKVNLGLTSFKDLTVDVSNLEMNVENNISLSLDKDVALKAANLLKTWNKSNVEEFFGDEYVDESE